MMAGEEQANTNTTEVVVAVLACAKLCDRVGAAVRLGGYLPPSTCLADTPVPTRISFLHSVRYTEIKVWSDHNSHQRNRSSG
jgi:hypothetical protein